MNFDQKDIELLEAYQREQLSAEDTAVVKARLVTDEEFQALFEELSRYERGIRQLGREALRAELRAIEQTLPPVEDQNSPAFFRSYPLWRMAAGISLIFGLGILLFFWSSEPVAVDGYLTPYPNIVFPVERGGTAASADARPQAYMAYDRGQYDLAIARFDQLDRLTTEDQFYQGLAYVLAEQYEEGIRRLDPVMKSASALRLPARWYTGLCYIKLDKPKEGASVLQPLIDQKTSYAAKAKEILN